MNIDNLEYELDLIFNDAGDELLYTIIDDKTVSVDFALDSKESTRNSFEKASSYIAKHFFA